MRFSLSEEGAEISYTNLNPGINFLIGSALRVLHRRLCFGSVEQASGSHALIKVAGTPPGEREKDRDGDGAGGGGGEKSTQERTCSRTGRRARLASQGSQGKTAGRRKGGAPAHRQKKHRASIKATASSTSCSFPRLEWLIGYERE